MMIFYKYICDYILENISLIQLIIVAIECVSNGIESNNLYILAGLNEKYDRSKISLYYQLTLEELNIKEPTKAEASNYLIKYYCNELINKKINPHIFLYQIFNDIYYKTFDIRKDKIYTGDNFGIENIIGIYFTIDELNENKINKNIKKEIEKEYIKCYKEAKKYLKNNK